jgi:hypothetical protein
MLRIISGGQTGVDRGALDAALEAGFPCGGSCPEGFKAEDGVIPERYPVEELANADYVQRTLRNIQDGDGTVIIYSEQPEGGTEQTLLGCLNQGVPYLLIDASLCSVGEAGRRIAAFVTEQELQVLNVAGPRASKWPDAREYTYLAVSTLFRHIS